MFSIIFNLMFAIYFMYTATKSHAPLDYILVGWCAANTFDAILWEITHEEEH